MRQVSEHSSSAFFAVETRVNHEHARVVPSGELALEAVGQVETAVGRLFERGHRSVVLDLTAVTFIDSTGLRLLIRLDAQARACGSRIGLVEGTGPVQRLLALTRLDARFLRAVA